MLRRNYFRYFRAFFKFLAHLSRRLTSELIAYQSSRRPCVCTSVCVFTLSNMNISETNGSIATKFYLKHHWGGGKAALGFGPDRIRTLVSMATESSRRVIMEKRVSPLFLGCFSSIPFILGGNDDMHKSSDEFEFRPDWTTNRGVSCPWTSEKIPIGL